MLVSNDNRLHAWGCGGHGSNYFIGNMDIQMNINEVIAAEFKKGERDAVIMALLVLAAFSVGILKVTGAI